MSAYWDNDIVRIALPPTFAGQRGRGETRARWLANIAEGLRKQASAINDQLVLVEAMQTEYEGRICMRCYGSRKIYVMDDQDSGHTEICPKCKGTGEQT
jgi:hypothetical protein